MTIGQAEPSAAMLPVPNLLLKPSPPVAGSDVDSLARTPSSLGDATLDGLGSEGTNGSEATPRVSDGGEGAAS